MKRFDDSSDDPGITPVFTAVIWVGCFAVGIAGILAPVIRLNAPAKKLSLMQATLIRVDLSQNAAPSPSASPSPTPQPTAQQQAETQSPPAPPPPLAAVAAPSPMIAFALPTEGLTRTTTAAEALPTRQQDQTDAAPAVQHITYGVGEGQQPKPEYPLEAQVAREYGAITIRFTIDEQGNVADAQIIKRCPYAELNQAALRGVRETWHFRPGPVRIAETEIDYAPKPGE